MRTQVGLVRLMMTSYTFISNLNSSNSNLTEGIPYHVKRINNGLGGLILEEVKVKLKHRTCNAVLLGL